MDIKTAQLLVSHGIRASLQRIAVMTFLRENHIHPTAEMVYSALHPIFPTLSRSTVYQALELFCEKGAARRLIVGDSEMRFEADISNHGHFRCVKCKRIFDFPYPEGTVLPTPKGNFRIQTQQLFYLGLCPSCPA